MSPRLKRWIAATVLVTCLALGCFFLVKRQFSPPAAYARIKLGMTLVEVEKAIGLPPGWYSSTPPMPISMSPSCTLIQESGLPYNRKYFYLPLKTSAADDKNVLTAREWMWDEYCICVVFDREQKSVGYYLLGWKAGLGTRVASSPG